MRTTSIATMLAIVLSAATVWAHDQSSTDLTIPQPNPLNLQGGFYEWVYQGETTLWQESNGKPTDGMYADPQGQKTLGLQLHNVCYGTFIPAVPWSQLSCANAPATGPDCLNCHHGNALFTYLPWGYFVSGELVDGTQADCEASGGVFFARDTLLYAPSGYDVHSPRDSATAHLGGPIVQCFPPGYGAAPGACMPAGNSCDVDSRCCSGTCFDTGLGKVCE